MNTEIKKLTSILDQPIHDEMDREWLKSTRDYIAKVCGKMQMPRHIIEQSNPGNAGEWFRSRFDSK